MSHLQLRLPACALPLQKECHLPLYLPQRLPHVSDLPANGGLLILHCLEPTSIVSRLVVCLINTLVHVEDLTSLSGDEGRRVQLRAAKVCIHTHIYIY